MSRVSRFGTAIGVVALAFLLVSESRASITLGGTGGWTTNPQVTGEVTWTYVSSALGSSSASSSLLFSGVTNTNLAVSSLVLGPGTYSLIYSVSASPGYVFTDADLDPTTGGVGNALTLSESFNGVLAMITTGSDISDHPISGSPTEINVQEQLIVTSGTTSGFNDSFLVQAVTAPPPVPEPASLVIWGVLATGGAGIGFWRIRRRREKSCP